jgi:phosphatidylinositol-3-phosphatase
MKTRTRSLLLALCAVMLLFAALNPVQAAGQPRIRHVFVLLLENENADITFGPGSPAPYLSSTLVSRGAFLPEYYGVTHLSLGNYIALVSGQGSNPQTQADCMVYTDFVGLTFGLDGQLLGQGCVYPASVGTIADQLEDNRLSWKGYMEDMGNDPARETQTCGHPAINASDPTQSADPGDQYAARHNPFVYFHSIIDSSTCDRRDVPLTRLPRDLSSIWTTPNFSFITPNLCHDGHDEPCANGEPGGLVSADAFLRRWVPRITGSPAFRRDGLLLITFDEAEADPSGGAPDASACCNQAQFPNTPNNGGPIPGMGGGRVGAVALSRFVAPGTVSAQPYNHFSTLRTVEDIFGLAHLGYAESPDPGTFGPDVFTAP